MAFGGPGARPGQWAGTSGALPGGPSSTATLPSRTVTVTVRPVGISQSRSVQTASAMARFCASSLGRSGGAAAAVSGTWAAVCCMGWASCC